MAQQKDKAKEVKLPEGVTEEMMSAWKEKYGEDKVKIIALPKDDDGNEFLDVVATVPSRKAVGEFEKWLDRDPNKAKEILINSCLLTSKEQVKSDDGLFYAAFDGITQLLPVRKAIIKN
ncbi:hypothetical protein [Acetobacteroides hydrogenigenes]|uniref:Uncharacterized protein n=1 Tax=Acetobacteroides hydrogenigenes TaxID=979970 RepID=A0A4R2E6W4_9BACT|nr:hypothetical protein [Acetobacteroides hydrogenigenes]TCN63681.1 hypothetical protein CLV25_11531 [Acetobacteroides hydrogenigenes]